MAFQGYIVLLGFLVLLSSVSNSIAATPSNNTDSLNWGSFPAGFIFGTASASYQVSPSFCTRLCHIQRSFASSAWDVKHDIYIYRYIRANVCLNFSMKVQQMKEVEDQVYGILTPIDIQVSLSLSLSYWKESISYQQNSMQYLKSKRRTNMLFNFWNREVIRWREYLSQNGLC